MTDADAFLAAIMANPSDDLPRLVFADWLDEHGDPARAEFIRLQIAVAHGDGSGFARSEELRLANEERWRIAGIHGGQYFRRGFVESLRMAAEEFVTHAERIGRSAPVTALRLSVAAGFTEDLEAVPWLPRLEELDLSGNLGVANWLDRFLTTVPLPNLRTLNLSNNGFFAETVPVIAAHARGYPHLERLNLSANRISDDGVGALAESPSFAGLTELVVRCEGLQYDESIHASGAAALAGSRHLTRLRYLDLAGHYIGDGGLGAIARSPNTRSLEHLDVSHNDIGTLGDSGVEALVESPYFEKLKVLNLSRNKIERGGMEALLYWPRLRQIETINLTGCVLGSSVYPILHSDRFQEVADRFLLDEPTLIG
jgi:uncharacterized protein (TIGR02996 family)